MIKEQRPFEYRIQKRNIRTILFLLFALSWGINGWDIASAAETPDEKLSISGITEALWDVTLSLSVSGTVVDIFFREGAYVEKGQVILDLDKEIEELEVARRKLIWESKAELESANAQVITLKTQFESNQELFRATKSVSREEVEKRELDYKLAVAEKKRLEAEEERQGIEYQMALENVRKRSLKSPISGIINKLFLDVGESCETEQPLVQIVDVSRCRLVCNMEEPIGRSLRKGQSVDLNIRTGDTTLLKKGTIVFVSPIVDPASGLLEVKAEFDNRDGKVRPGVTGYIIIE